MKKIMNEHEYDEIVKSGCRSEYPRVLTSDGFIFGQEYHHDYDQWRPDNTIIATIRVSDDWPTYIEATRLRRKLRRKQ